MRAKCKVPSSRPVDLSRQNLELGAVVVHAEVARLEHRHEPGLRAGEMVSMSRQRAKKEDEEIRRKSRRTGRPQPMSCPVPAFEPRVRKVAGGAACARKGVKSVSVGDEVNRKRRTNLVHLAGLSTLDQAEDVGSGNSGLSLSVVSELDLL
jgi:hypothetical protein